NSLHALRTPNPQLRADRTAYGPVGARVECADGGDRGGEVDRGGGAVAPTRRTCVGRRGAGRGGESFRRGRFRGRRPRGPDRLAGRAWSRGSRRAGDPEA